MLKIETKQKTKEANGFCVGELFHDGDGDLCIRCEGGCVRFNGEEMFPYSTDEMDDVDAHAYFVCCTPAQGDIKIKIKLR